MSFSHITGPTLLLNTSTAKANIRRMAEKCRKLGLGFNPHFKTHQSREIGTWFKEEGVERITVSSIAMAEYFADAGWSDITLAFPVDIQQTGRLNKLAGRSRLSLDVISKTAAITLKEKLEHPVEIVIEVDAGYGRTGIPVSEHRRIEAILNVIDASENLSFYGFYIHAGHTYDVRGKESVESIHRQTLSGLGMLRTRFETSYPDLRLSLGDTPSCSMMNEFTGIDEIRPGNFVFYDVTQAEIGSCTYTDIAVALAAPVVSKEPVRHEIVVHAGAIHLSKDWLTQGDVTHFGLIAPLGGSSWGEPWKGCYVRKVSQEHGIIRLTKEAFSSVEVGDSIAVLPVHSCLTADCMGSYLTENSDPIEMLNWRTNYRPGRSAD